MRKTMFAAIAASTLMLAGCGGNGDDTLGDQAEQNYDNAADAMDAMADNMANDAASDAMEQNADAMREKGDETEEAIDDSDVNAAALTNAQKEEMTTAK